MKSKNKDILLTTMELLSSSEPYCSQQNTRDKFYQNYNNQNINKKYTNYDEDMEYYKKLILDINKDMGTINNKLNQFDSDSFRSSQNTMKSNDYIKLEKDIISSIKSNYAETILEKDKKLLQLEQNRKLLLNKNKELENQILKLEEYAAIPSLYSPNDNSNNTNNNNNVIYEDKYENTIKSAEKSLYDNNINNINNMTINNQNSNELCNIIDDNTNSGELLINKTLTDRKTKYSPSIFSKLSISSQNSNNLKAKKKIKKKKSNVNDNNNNEKKEIRSISQTRSNINNTPKIKIYSKRSTSNYKSRNINNNNVVNETDNDIFIRKVEEIKNLIIGKDNVFLKNKSNLLIDKLNNLVKIYYKKIKYITNEKTINDSNPSLLQNKIDVLEKENLELKSKINRLKDIMK